MKLNITKKQYEIIIRALDVSSYVYGPLSDFADKKYKKESSEIDAVKDELLSHTKEFDFEENVEDFEGKNVLTEEYSEKTLDDMFTYDDYVTFDNLAGKLGMRDFRKKYTQEEIDKMAEEHHGYLGVPLYEFEKKYYDEFNENEYDRLYIKD